jgi:hypothetical protein
MNVMGVVVRSGFSWSRGCLSSVAVAAALLLGCGGRASSGGGHEGGSKGGSPATQGVDARPIGGTAAITSPEPNPPQGPSTVSLLGGDEGTSDPAATPDTSLGPCFASFSAVLNGMRVGLIAFVQEPGDYTGDSIHILFAHATATDGRSYKGSAGINDDGQIQLHVSSVVPRFAGTAELLLIDEAQPELAPLALSLAFDISWPRPCGS